MQAMDTSHVCLISVMLHADAFEGFRCDRPRSLGGWANIKRGWGAAPSWAAKAKPWGICVQAKGQTLFQMIWGGPGLDQAVPKLTRAAAVAHTAGVHSSSPPRCNTPAPAGMSLKSMAAVLKCMGNDDTVGGTGGDVVICGGAREQGAAGSGWGGCAPPSLIGCAAKPCCSRVAGGCQLQGVLLALLDHLAAAHTPFSQPQLSLKADDDGDRLCLMFENPGRWAGLSHSLHAHMARIPPNSKQVQGGSPTTSCQRKPDQPTN